MGMSYDDSEFKKLLKDLSKVKDEVMKPAYKYFKSVTPIRSGYARNHTHLRVNNTNATISADYDYSGQLDEGKSKQSPKGMTDPTEKEIERLVDKYIKKVGK